MKTEMFGELYGEDWEKLCQQMLKLRYNGLNYDGASYQVVPAKYGGDLGIEGFVNNGTLIQCYCPEENEVQNSLYEHQRNKITKDINKLIKNISEINKLTGNFNVVEWHFLTPNYDNKALLAHCREKEKLILDTIPEHVNVSFSILLKTETDFIIEAEMLVQNGLHKIELSTEINDFGLGCVFESDNDILNRIRTKIEQIDKVKSNPTKLANLVKTIFEQYEEGQNELSRLQRTYPQLSIRIRRLKQTIEKRIQAESLTSSVSGGELLTNTRSEYRNVLEKAFDKNIQQDLIECLTNEAIADWLVRCPLSL